MTTHLNPSSCVHSKFVFIITNSRDTSPPLIISTPPPDPLTYLAPDPLAWWFGGALISKRRHCKQEGSHKTWSLVWYVSTYFYYL